jgi:RNA polymerase sigma-70 factor (ECF subfamily)
MPEVNELKPLLARTREGDRAALSALLGKLRPWVRLLARPQLDANGQLDASDLAQEALLRIYLNLPRLRPGGVTQLLAWVRLVVRAAAIDHWRETGRGRPITHHADARLLEDVFGDETPDQRALGDELALQLAWAIERLSPAQRAVIQARFLDGLSFVEVAARVGKSVGAVRVVCLRAIERLRRDCCLKAYRPEGM